MSQAPDRDSVVITGAGLPIEEAAAWVGASCWIELAVHEVLTRWLVDEADPATSSILWAVRAHRAELAETWHRRLPELREMPRADFVKAPKRWAGRLAADGPLASASGSTERVAALREALEEVRHGYQQHQTMAVGPADGPVADTLRQAIARTDADLALLRFL